MSEGLKFRPSPLLVLTRVATAVCIIGFCILTVLGTVDLRTEEQRLAERRQIITSDALFDDAVAVLKQYRRDFNPGVISRLSCVAVVNNGNPLKAALITTDSGGEHCYIYSQSIKMWVLTNDDVYRHYSTSLRVTDELVLEGDDLTTLYEEANK